MVYSKAVQRIFFSFILLISATTSSAEVPIFNHYGTSDGLSTLAIRAITQDKTGYLWIGTKKGIFKYDAYQFIKQSIVNDQIDIKVNHLFVDQKNRLWVATDKNNIFVMKDDNWRTISTEVFGENTFTTAITQSQNGLIWAATNHGIGYYSEENDTFVSITTIDQNVSSLNIAPNNHLWFGTRGQLNLYDIKNKKLQEYPIKSNPTVTIHDILINQQEVWLGTSKGLLIFNQQTQSFSPGPSDIAETRILKVIKNKDEIWIASIDHGLFHINNEGQVSNYKNSDFEYSLSDPYIMSLYLSNNNLTS